MEDATDRGPEVKTSLGVEENLEGLLAYVAWWLTGIILLLLERESDFVRFHAMQSTITFLGITVLAWILAVIPFIGLLLSHLLWLLGVILWIVGMVKAYQGERYKFPFIGDLAEQWLGKVNI